jgi:pimeloyl-ACP methyl ester carboxylesterase
VGELIQTSAGPISYRELGAGPVILCLHEGSPGADGWSSFGPAARDLSDRFRVVVPDQPGFGASALAPDTGYQAMCAQAMAELLGALGVETAHVAGNSLGGGVAMLMGLDYPELVDKLVLIAPWTAGIAGARTSVPPAVRLLLNYYPAPSREKMHALLRALSFGPAAPDEAAATARYESTLLDEHEAGYLQTLRSPEVPSPRLAGLGHEVLLLWGLEDAFCPVEDALEYLALLRNSRLVLFPRCGHSVHLERPGDFRTQVCSFLEA